MKDINKSLFIGVYISTSHFNNLLEALEKTKELGANVLQVYLGDNVLTTLSKKFKPTLDEIRIFKEFIKINKLKFFVHSILSLNFCKDPLNKRNEWGITNIVYDMNLCYKLGGEGVVVHMGTYKTDSLDISYAKGVDNFVKSLILILDQTKKIPLILETPVNKKYKIGSTIENLFKIYYKIPIKYRKRIKFCIDTQHIFASGYNISSIEGISYYFEHFDKLIGIKKIALIHLNDSYKEYDSHINKHESIKKGYIFANNGEKSLKYIIDFIKKHNIPALMETNYENYNKEIPYLKQLGGKKINIKDKIIKIFKTLLTYYQSTNIINKSTKYRIDSYIKAIKVLERINTPIYNSSNLKNISFIGKKLSDKINEIAQTGTLKQYENIKKNYYLNSIQLFQNIWGVGPKFAKELIHKNIYTINNLKEAIKKNKIILSEQQRIGLKYYNNLKNKISRSEVEEYTNFIKNLLNDYSINIYNAGSYRSGKKYLGDIDLIVTYNNVNDINDINDIFYKKLIEENILYETLQSGENKSIYIIKLPNKNIYRKIDVAFIEEKYLPWYLLYFGSSREFSKKIRGIASKLGYKLNEKGLFNKETGIRLNFNPKNEEEIFNYLKITYVKPENR